MEVAGQLEVAADVVAGVGAASAAAGRVSFFLNICNIRSVTTNPPTTLIVATINAINPSHFAHVPPTMPATTIAPTMVIPLIAFDPDIRGVSRDRKCVRE